MIRDEMLSIITILRGSPFFAELSIKEREAIITELLWSYPELVEHAHCEEELGYEASWLMNQNF